MIENFSLHAGGGSFVAPITLVEFAASSVLPDARCITNVSDVRADVCPNPAMAKLAVDLEKIVLGLFNQQDSLAAQLHRLPANLRADASPPRQ